ncbi:uncharacterized protein BDZ99DRAFT_474459 [Mytilinidion resinicola]|uniref:Uncharacterized protein n=1 Tax=Mytilinidion resinicola TaxID=574789 RepID=A0A6A6YWI4_9PEZI|nr:uncharacterized protein BDZ99DRAFT_474459 [Mytilinidion resinicola]KAF2812257.1 hypothetical protein BDZ99DRAFT_474459 [Mytilinidion resinicola]
MAVFSLAYFPNRAGLSTPPAPPGGLFYMHTAFLSSLGHRGSAGRQRASRRGLMAALLPPYGCLMAFFDSLGAGSASDVRLRRGLIGALSLLGVLRLSYGRTSNYNVVSSRYIPDLFKFLKSIFQTLRTLVYAHAIEPLQHYCQPQCIIRVSFRGGSGYSCCSQSISPNGSAAVATTDIPSSMTCPICGIYFTVGDSRSPSREGKATSELLKIFALGIRHSCLQYRHQACHKCKMQQDTRKSDRSVTNRNPSSSAHLRSIYRSPTFSVGSLTFRRLNE